ncbi:unnamed protein product, partial [Meganyctiphanes norvegica]
MNNVLAEIKNSTTYNKLNMEERNEDTDTLDGDSDSSIERSHKAVPSGFTSYNDRIVLLPTALGGTVLSWHDSVSRCSRHGAVPFIPKSVDDFRYIQQVNTDIGSGSGIWLPASDHVTEGVVNWTDDSDASSTLKLFDWHRGDYPADNGENGDCVNIWTSYKNKLEFEGFTTVVWPMISRGLPHICICELIC